MGGVPTMAQSSLGRSRMGPDPFPASKPGLRSVRRASWSAFQPAPAAPGQNYGDST